MKILGICGSSRSRNVSWLHRLLVTVLDAVGYDHEIVELRETPISVCNLCLECADDQICKKGDAMALWRHQIVSADAFVMGAPTYFSTMNAATYAFLERWGQFRGRNTKMLAGKIGIALGIRWSFGQDPGDEIEKIFQFQGIKTVGKVSITPVADRMPLPSSEHIPDKWLRMAADAGRMLKKNLSSNSKQLTI